MFIPKANQTSPHVALEEANFFEGAIVLYPRTEGMSLSNFPCANIGETVTFLPSSDDAPVLVGYKRR
jgi:hypothetical protein